MANAQGISFSCCILGPMLYGGIMSNDHNAPMPEDDDADAPVSFTPSEHRQLVAAVRDAVSEALGGMAVSATFHPEDRAFVVRVVQGIAPGEKN